MRIVTSVVLFPILLLGQEKHTATASQGPEKGNVYYQSWETGEIKSCDTYSGQPFLLICDGSNVSWKDSFVNLLGDFAAAGSSEAEAYTKAFAVAASRSKMFLVSFSENAWPEPRTGRKMAMSTCTKDSTIKCKLSARE